MKKTILLSAALPLLLYADVFDLGQIEVAAQTNKADVNVAIVDEDQMKLNNAVSAPEVANFTPGVSIQKGGNARNESNILVRGFTSLEVPIFIDGIPVYVPYDGNMDLGRFTTFDLSQINISKGASSVLYGPNTMGGAINLVTKKPSKELEGTLGYGTHTGRSSKSFGNYYYGDIGTKQELFYIQANASFVDNDGVQMSKESNILEENKNNRKNRDNKFGIKAAYTPNDTDEYAISYINQKGRKDAPLYEGKRAGQSKRYWKWPNWDKESIYFLSNTEFEGWYIKTKAYYDTFYNKLKAYDNAKYNSQTKRSTFTSIYEDYTYGFGLEAGVEITDNDLLKFAPSYKRDVHREHNVGDPVQRYEDETYSLALENTHNFSEQTKLITGISYDSREALKAINYGVTPTSNNQSVLYDMPLKKQNALSYQIALKHSFMGDDELTLSFAKKTRFATIKERYSFRFGRAIPNPDLKPEEAYHYEIGYNKTFNEWLNLSGAIFYSDVKNKIQDHALGYFNAAGEEMFQMQNVQKASFKGFELGAIAYLLDNLEVGANYTYVNADSKKDEIFITDVPKHKGFVYANWEFMPKLSLYVSQYAESGRHSYSDGKNDPAGFAKTDVKLIYKPMNSLVVDAGVSNIFDKSYAYKDGYYEEGRVFFTNIRYEF